MGRIGYLLVLLQSSYCFTSVYLHETYDGPLTAIGHANKEVRTFCEIHYFPANILHSFLKERRLGWMTTSFIRYGRIFEKYLLLLLGPPVSE